MGEYKFQSLLIYQISLDYIDKIYDLIKKLPGEEKYNLSSQLVRAATSIALNIAEGSTGQSDKEQSRFLSLALRSYLETVACLDLIQRRNYISLENLKELRKTGRTLFYKITTFRKSLKNNWFSPVSPRRSPHARLPTPVSQRPSPHSGRERSEQPVPSAASIHHGSLFFYRINIFLF